jgi:hypothetical protein
MPYETKYDKEQKVKQLFGLVLAFCFAPAQAQVTQQVASGPIRFNDVQQERGAPQQVIKLGGKIEVVFNLSALTDGKGHELIDAPSEAINKTASKLHYVAHVALFDEEKNLIAVLGSEDVFSSGVSPNRNYKFATRAVVPPGRSREIRSYQATLFVSTGPLQ